jgi:hypothetical protein
VTVSIEPARLAATALLGGFMSIVPPVFADADAATPGAM